MRRIKEVLRLRYELGLGQRQIARRCSIGQSTVFDYLKRAEAAGLRWPLPGDWDDERLERSLFAYGQHEQPSPQRPQPDFESIHLGHWLTVLKQNKRAIFSAAAHAQRAADYLGSLQQKEQSEAA